MHSQRPALSGPLQAAWHIVLVVFGWVLFGGFWWLVLQQGSNSLSSIVWLISAALVLLPVITLYWVLHNRGIYDRKGPRRQVQVIEKTYAQDWAGRPVRADFGKLRQTRLITIDSTADEKRFLASPEQMQSYPEAA